MSLELKLLHVGLGAAYLAVGMSLGGLLPDDWHLAVALGLLILAAAMLLIVKSRTGDWLQ